MTHQAKPPPRQRRRPWGEQVPLAIGALLVVAGAALIVAVLLGPRSPGSGPTAIASVPTLAASSVPSSSATPAGTSVPPPTPAPTAQPTPRVIAENALDLTWRSVATLPGTAADPATQTVIVSGLAHGQAGYLAVGEIVDGFLTETGATGPIHPALWTSPDGLAWQLADAEALGPVTPTGVAASAGIMLVTATTPDGTVVLRSTGDGGWVAVTPSDSRLSGILAAGPGFVAFGERVSTRRQAIWTSTDGTGWRRAWESSEAAGEFLSSIATRPDGTVVVGGSQLRSTGGVRATAMVSRDGTAWTRAALANLPPTMGLDAIGLGADGSWYGAGFDDARGGIGVWRSADGLHWRPTEFGAAQATEQTGDTGSATAVFALDGRTVVLAFTSCCGDPPQRSLVSTDGQRWERADRATAVRSVRLTALLVEPGRVLAVGGLNRGAGVWLATAAPRDGVEFASELTQPLEGDVCGTSGEQKVRVDVVRTGTVARIHLVRQDGTGAELGQVIWPFGWHATTGPPLTISNAHDEVVLREGDELTLSGGVVTGTSYHVCDLNGTAAWKG